MIHPFDKCNFISWLDLVFESFLLEIMTLAMMFATIQQKGTQYSKKAQLLFLATRMPQSFS